MPIEQASGAPVDFRTDQFSLGAMLYELATGTPPFRKETTIDTLSSILHDDPQALAQANPKTPVLLRSIIERRCAGFL